MKTIYIITTIAAIATLAYGYPAPHGSYGGSSEGQSYGGQQSNGGQSSYGGQQSNGGQSGYGSQNQNERPKTVYINRVLPPTIVNEPARAPIHVNAGQPFVVRQPPVVFKQPRGYVVQKQVINRSGDPINYNPIFIKVNEGRPTPPAQSYGSSNSYGSGASNSYGSGASNSYGSGASNSYGSEPSAYGGESNSYGSGQGSNSGY